jgi:hypothetical protein
MRFNHVVSNFCLLSSSPKPQGHRLDAYSMQLVATDSKSPTLAHKAYSSKASRSVREPGVIEGAGSKRFYRSALQKVMCSSPHSTARACAKVEPLSHGFLPIRTRSGRRRRYCAMTDSPWLTATSRIFAGRSNGSSMLNPRGRSGVCEKKLTSSCKIGLGNETPRISAEPS